LIVAAAALPGCFRTLDLSRAEYFSTLIRVAWDSGLRRRDLHKLRTRDLQPEWVHYQQKTAKPVRVRLRASTLDVVKRWARRPDAVLWPLWGTDEVFRSTFAKIVRTAGIPPGPFKRIRKSSGTAAEAACPGAGHLLLGNTRRVFERHYLDAAQVAGPQPPELG
jgi:integrase